MMKEFMVFCKNKRIFIILIALISLLAMVLLYKSSESRRNMFVFEENEIQGVKGESINQGVSLSVTAIRNGVSVERDVILKKGLVKESDKAEHILSEEDEMNIEITRLIREMNQTEEDVLVLPNQIGDSMILEWKRSESEMTWLLPIIFPPLLLMFMYRGEKDEVKQKERREAYSILNELPSFNNKLVLLLGSGLVYEECLKRIAITSDDGLGVTSLLPRKLGTILKEAERTNGDTTKLLNEYARKKKISELKRMTTIIMDNQKKGTDLRSKLALEGELLWEKRKKRAEEQGRIAESKLTLPLGIMMIALLIITAGPALMQM